LSAHVPALRKMNLRERAEAGRLSVHKRRGQFDGVVPAAGRMTEEGLSMTPERYAWGTRPGLSHDNPGRESARGAVLPPRLVALTE